MFYGFKSKNGRICKSPIPFHLLHWVAILTLSVPLGHIVPKTLKNSRESTKQAESMEMCPSGISWCTEHDSVIIFLLEHTPHHKNTPCFDYFVRNLTFFKFISEIIQIHCRGLPANYLGIIRLHSTLFHEKCTFICIKYQWDNVSTLHQKIPLGNIFPSTW